MRFLGHFLLLCLAGAQLQHYWPQLPPDIATHFGANGVANGFVTKHEFLRFYAGLCIFMPVAMMGTLGLSFRYLPAKFINIPNRHYWLAPERRDATILRLSRAMAGFSYGVQLYIIAVGQIVITANLSTPPKMDNAQVGAVMGVMGVLFIGFMISQYRAFRLPPEKTQ